MRSSRGAVCAAVLTAALALAACTDGGGAKPTASTITTLPATISATTLPTTTPPTTPKPTPVKTTVPVDQIPPGNPTSWVPAGVPTTAKYKEPGDVVPKFTQAMFKNTYDGAIDVMHYYFEAVNWDLATGATPTIFKSFCPTACDQEVKYSLQRVAKRQHYRGGRYLSGSPTVIPAPRSHAATWAGQFDVTVTSGKLLGQKGNTVGSFKKAVVGMELDVKFNGKHWNLVGIYFVS